MDMIAFQSLASTIQQHVDKGTFKLVITSSGPGEGKSTIASHLGRALAKSGRQNVILMDTDPFKPTVHHVLGLDNRKGLGNLLKEVYQADLRDGTPQGFGIGDWVELLRAQSKTGRLMIAQGEEEFTISFVRGRVGSLFRGQRPEDATTASLLVQSGRISEEQKNVALRMQQEGQKPLPDVLHGLGYAQASEVESASQMQLQDTLRRMASLDRPQFVFSETPVRGAAAGRHPESVDGDGVDRFLSEHFDRFLPHPFLSSRIPGYLTSTAMENFKVLTSGTVSYDLAEVAFSMLTERLGRIFDIVLMDSPPVALTSPTRTLTALAHGVLFVVKAEGFDLRIIQQAKEQLERAGANVLGVILNQVDVRHDESLAYYYGAYHQ